MKNILKVRQLKSLIGKSKKIRLIVSYLGLDRVGSINFIVDNSSARGMIKKVQHIISVERYKLQ